MAFSSSTGQSHAASPATRIVVIIITNPDETLAGIKTLQLFVENGKVAKVRVDMGSPILTPAEIPVVAEGDKAVDEPILVDGKEYHMTCVSMGNPHAVVYVDDVYKVAQLLTNQDDIQLIEMKDYIQNPKESGYMSLHLVLEVPIFLSEGPKPIHVEVQLRTIAMDFWASLEHKLKYKTDNNVSDDVKKELQECAKSIAEIDLKMQNIHNRLNSKNI